MIQSIVYRLDMRKHAFSESMAEHWNRLPREMDHTLSLSCLKGIWTMQLVSGPVEGISVHGRGFETR